MTTDSKNKTQAEPADQALKGARHLNKLRFPDLVK